MLIITGLIILLSLVLMILIRNSDISAVFAGLAAIATFFFVILVFAWILATLIFSYDAKHRFEKEYRLIQYQSKLLQTKKEAVLEQSSKIKQTDSISEDIIGLVDRAYLEKMIEEIQKIETSIVHRKSELLTDIETHNAMSAFWFWGKYQVSDVEEKFSLLYNQTAERYTDNYRK